MPSPILDVIEVYDGRGAERSADGVRRQYRKFHVKTVSGLTDSNVVLNAGNTEATQGGPRVPRMYEHYQAPDGSYDFTLRVDDLKAVPNKAHDLWEVTARYATKLRRDAGSAGGLGSGGGTPPPPGGGGEPAPIPGLDIPWAGGAGGGPDGQGGTLSLQDNPLLRPPEISFYAVKRRIVADKQMAGLDEGKAIKNSAGAPFDPPLEREETALGLTITRNQAAFLAGTIRTYIDTVNLGSWRGQQPRTCRMVDIQAQQAIEGATFFWRVTYKIEIAPAGKTWVKEVLDQGTYYLASGKKVSFIDDRGRHVGKGLLNGSGGKLPDGDAPVYLSAYLFDETDWSGLNL